MVPNGGTFTIQTSVAVQKFSMVRASSTTHAVNTDQRHFALAFTKGKRAGFSYEATVESDPGLALPGFWYVFAITAAGVPSVATFVQITPPT